ncbi:MAG: CotH kinase family protein [Saprospiraceae bacterium]|nr:CotH kinase family protein [Saprospiraceae bacterium]
MKRFLLAFLVFASIEFSLDAQNFTNSKLPIFVVNTSGGAQIVDEPKTIAHLGVIWNGDGATNYLTDPFNEYDGQIGIEIRGSSSQSFPKKNYAMETQNADSTSNNVSVLGFPKENDWVLHGPYSDKTLMRNALAFTLGSWIMPYAPRVRYCELVINGDYRGVYVFTEKIKQDDNRVNISKLAQMKTQGTTSPAVISSNSTSSTGWCPMGFLRHTRQAQAGVRGALFISITTLSRTKSRLHKRHTSKTISPILKTSWPRRTLPTRSAGYRSMLDVPSVIQMIFHTGNQPQCGRVSPQHFHVQRLGQR